MSYPGGKGAAGVVQTIINQQPPHDVYIEAFRGSGAVMRAKKPARVNIGIDLDPSTIANFRGAGSGVELLCTHAARWILARRAKPWTGRELIYCDPPYLMSTRRNWSKMYRFEMDDNDHAFLLTQLVSLPCMVQISGYPSAMYSEWLKGWRVIEYQAATRHGIRTECLWMNYPEPQVLHDFSHLGRDYRERERIKRKAVRWESRLNSLPRLEKLAIYAEMASSIVSSGGVAGGFPSDRAQDRTAISDDGARHTPPDRAVQACDRPSSPDAEVLQ